MATRKNVERARSLRRAMSPPELKLWTLLRDRPGSFRFRRQHPIGNNFVLDFYCPTAKLAIEVDGIAHDMGNRPARDAARDAYVASKGIATMRIGAADVMKECEAVVRMILDRCASPLHRPSDGPPPHPADGED